MKKYFKIITLSLSLTFFLANHVFAESESSRPTSYLVTAFKLEYCFGSSSISSCEDSTTVGTSTAGFEMDLSDSSSAVAFGNAGLLVTGTTYTHAQITMKRLFKVGGSVVTSAATCKTGGTAGTEDAGGATNGTSGAAQAMAARDDAGGAGQNINSVSAVGGTNTAGTLTDDENFLQFRWELSQSFTPQAGKIPNMAISFDLSGALVFNDGGSGDGACDGDDFYPGEPRITNTFN